MNKEQFILKCKNINWYNLISYALGISICIGFFIQICLAFFNGTWTITLYFNKYHEGLLELFIAIIFIPKTISLLYNEMMQKSWKK